MPPHCDSIDGPVCKAAGQALDREDVNLILPFVPADSEQEVIDAYEKVIKARKESAEAKGVADRFFFETVVRIHRAGEGAPFTGLKPAGLGHGPVVPVAEKAIESGSADELLKLMSDFVQNEIREKFQHVMHLKKMSETAPGDVAQAREYVSAMLGLQVYSHKLYQCAKTGPHETHHAHAG